MALAPCPGFLQEALAFRGQNPRIQLLRGPDRDASDATQEMVDLRVIRDAEQRNVLRGGVDQAVQPHTDQQAAPAHFPQHILRVLRL
ncbi:hypothetical protein D3C81_1240980 [compost metagenome]